MVFCFLQGFCRSRTERNVSHHEKNMGSVIIEELSKNIPKSLQVCGFSENERDLPV